MVGEVNWNILNPNTPQIVAGSFAQGAANRQEQAMNALRLKREQQAMTDEETMRNLLAQYGGDMQKASQALMQSGQYKPAMEMQAQLAAQQKAKTDLALNHAKLIKDRANFVYANPTLQNAVSSIQEVGSQTGADVSGELSRLQSIGDNPEAIKQWAAGHAIEADKLIPKIQSMNLGGMESLARIDPLTGKIVSQQNFRKTMTPGEAANLAQSERHFQATQNAPTFNAEAGGFVVKPTAQNPQGGIIPVAGFAENKAKMEGAKAVATSQKDANDALMIIGEAEKILNKGKATGSYAGKAADIIAGGIGYSTQGAREAASLKALSGALVAKMPKMSGPQSDKDVQLYREMAGQIGDDTLPIATRKAAIRTVKNLQEKYAGNESAPSSISGGWSVVEH